MLYNLIPYLLIFVFGAMIGSFLNVCIIRVPKEESIVFPASHCVSCKKPIAWFDNVPLVSFLVLRGRCRHCKTTFSWQYFWVELLTACLFVVFYHVFDFTPKGVIYLALSLALLVESFIDMKYRIIPDGITLPGIVLGLVLSGVFPVLHGKTQWYEGLLAAFIGLLVGGGFLFLAGTIAEWALKKEAMGGGDVKLLAMIGTVIGWPGVLWTIFASSFIGSFVGVYQRLKQGDELIPYGPFLALGAFLYLFFGPAIILWYMGTLRTV